MALIVQKFGGTSVGGIDRIEGVADRIVQACEGGDDIVVVLSAMAGETDRLLGLARAISTHGRPNPRELDVLLATGEQVTIALLCMALEKRGVTARSFTGVQAGIRTDGGHTKARIAAIDATALREQLDRGRVPVIAGFQGADEQGNITTLGRGGSDTTAVAIAVALKADECRIFTDVDGVYTADPRLVPEARRLERVSFEEMLEMAGQGSKVLQIRSVEFAHKYNMPLRVLSTFSDGCGTPASTSTGTLASTMTGTLIVERLETVESARIAGIACSRDEAEIRISGVPAAIDAVSRLLAPLADNRIDVDMIVQNMAADGRMNVAFTVSRQDYDQALEILALQFSGHDVCVEGDSRVAKVGLVGAGVRTQAGVAARMFAALSRAGVAVRQIATSELRISVVVDEIQMENAARALHHEFRLDEPAAAVKAG